MDNNMESMLDVYLFEANSLLEQLDEIILSCEKQGSFDTDSINEIFRIMHTIKGSSAMMQFNSLATISHKTEDLFFIVREKGVSKEHHEKLIDMLFKCSDFLKEEVGKVENNEPLTVDIGSFEQEINDFIKIISSDTPEEPASQAVSVPSSPETGEQPAPEAAQPSSGEDVSAQSAQDKPPAEVVFVKTDTVAERLSAEYPLGVSVLFEDDCEMKNLRAMMLLSSVSEVCKDVKHFPEDLTGSDELIEKLTRDGFLLCLKTKEDAEKAEEAAEKFIYAKSHALLHYTPPAEENKQSAAAVHTPPAQDAPSAAIQNAAKQSLINVNLSKLDTLMDLVGEIVISEAMLTATPINDSAVTDLFSKNSRELTKLTDELQDIVMSIRMVPVSGVFQKMHRIVRDMCKKLDKQADLVLVGEETEVDKAIIDLLGDPLMHIIRNSMDHGIEVPEERAKIGKEPKGTVTLSAENTGGEILIRIKDDGRGMDPAKILAKAKKNGILTKPESEYSKKEILALTLAPGFSTNEVVTEFSGRGVGMDVVKKNLEKINGEVSIDSFINQGTETVLKIPLTLAIVKGIEMKVGDLSFTIPINNIRQTFKIKASDIVTDSKGREIILLRDQYYPILRLHRHLDLETQVTDIEEGILILVESGDFAFCVFADSLLGENQVVLKPLSSYLNKYSLKEIGIAGCSILGNGSISLILDVSNLGKNL